MITRLGVELPSPAAPAVLLHSRTARKVAMQIVFMVL